MREAVFVEAEGVVRVACVGIQSLKSTIAGRIPPGSEVIESRSTIDALAIVENRREGGGLRRDVQTGAVMDR